MLQMKTEEEQLRFLKGMSSIYYERDDEKLPVLFTLLATGSNGMAAGNTFSEAVV